MITTTPNMFIVGAGAVATALAGGLRQAGIPVLGLWARTPAAARAAGVSAGVASYSAAPPDLLLEADGVVVAVSDTAISEVARMLLATGLISTKHTLLHCSGANASREVFADVADRVAGVATLHPLRAISDARDAMTQWQETIFGIEGDAVGLNMARNLVGGLGAKALVLGPEQMASYHAAATMASNYLVSLLHAAAQTVKGSDIDEASALAALLPLAQSSLDNIRERGLSGGLTGPIQRGDVDTVARHLAAIPESARGAYCTLGLHAVELARHGETAEPKALDEIRRMLTTTK